MIGTIEKMEEIINHFERLITRLNDCRNELCNECGRYKEAHKGACDDCRWKEGYLE